MVRHYVLPAIACIVSLCIAVALVLPSTADETSAQNPKSEIKQLQDKIARLEARVAALEKKPVYAGLVARPDAALSLPEKSPLPKGWTQQEFNGMKYYIVPLRTKE